MLTLRDHTSATPPDFWIQLGAKRKQLLDRSWAGVFRPACACGTHADRDYLLLELPVAELAPHFSKDFGRPSKDLHVVLGALVLQQLHDLTDTQTVEAIDLDTSGCIQRCPAGHAPLQMSVSKKRLQVRFAIDVCGQCPLQERCPIKGKERLQYTHERIKQRARRLSEQSDAFRDPYRWPAGIEATISRLPVRCTQTGLKHQMGLAHLQVPGQGAVQYRVLLRALGLNIHRVAVYRGSFYPEKLFGRLLSASRCRQRVLGPYKPISGRTRSRFEGPPTRVCRWPSPLISRLFAVPSTFKYTSERYMIC